MMTDEHVLRTPMLTEVVSIIPRCATRRVAAMLLPEDARSFAAAMNREWESRGIRYEARRVLPQDVCRTCYEDKRELGLLAPQDNTEARQEQDASVTSAACKTCPHDGDPCHLTDACADCGVPA